MIQPPLGKPWLLYVLLGSSLALNLVMVLDRPDTAPAPALADADAAAAAAAAPAPGQAVAPGEAVAPTQAASLATALPVAAPAVPVPEGWRITRASVEGSVARTFQLAVGDEGDALSAAYARLFVWDMDLRRDPQRGDQVEVLWRPDPQSVVEILGARYVAVGQGRTLEAWRWQPPGEAFAAYWNHDGRSVERRIVQGPLEHYEQITALLKDRPNHKGMDFKTPVGTPVESPKAATVARVNWNHGNNGDCIELRYDDGVTAKMLHLSEIMVAAGQRVQAGQVIAKSGNTGHSTAPHLHYELHRADDTVIDPLDYHAVEQLQLQGDTLVAFQSEETRLAALLDQPVAMN